MAEFKLVNIAMEIVGGPDFTFDDPDPMKARGYVGTGNPKRHPEAASSQVYDGPYKAKAGQDAGLDERTYNNEISRCPFHDHLCEECGKMFKHFIGGSSRDCPMENGEQRYLCRGCYTPVPIGPIECAKCGLEEGMLCKAGLCT